MSKKNITAVRYHDISCGHRVSGHESKCRHLHGHNYRITFHVAPDDNELDTIGRVLDFSVIKTKLCMWIEDNWDHKFLAWSEDPVMNAMYASLQVATMEVGTADGLDTFKESIVWTPFNPTAENMAQYLVDVMGPLLLKHTGCKLVKCEVEETRKCKAEYENWGV